MSFKSRYQSIVSRVRKWLVSLDLLDEPQRRVRVARKNPLEFLPQVKAQLVEHAALCKHLYGEAGDGPRTIYVVTDLISERSKVLEMLESLRPLYVAASTRIELMSTAYASTGWTNNESNVVLLAFTARAHPLLREQLTSRLRHPNSTTVIFSTRILVRD